MTTESKKNRLNAPVHISVPGNTSFYVHVNVEPKSPKQQAPKRVHQKLLISSHRKEPWVPPPAKTTRRTKPLSTKNIQVNVDEEVTHSEKLSETRLQDDSNQMYGENEGNANNFYVCDVTEMEEMDPELGSDNRERTDINDQEMKLLFEEFEKMEHHGSSLQSLVQFLLSKMPKMLFIEEDLKNLVTSADQLTKDCIMSFDLVKSHLNPSGSKFDSVFLAVKQMNYTFSKLLGSYECIGLILQLVLENQEQMGISALHSKLESLRQILKATQDKYLESEGHIQDLEVRLSASQAEVISLKVSKGALEDTRSELLEELTNKESQLKILDTKLKNLHISNSVHKERDHLIEIMEEFQQRSAAEIKALEKSIKYQKTRAEQNEEIISRLQAKLREKEDLFYSIAAERDEWKVKMTVATNQLTELEGQVFRLKRQAEKSQLLLQEHDSAHKEKLSKLNSAIEEKSTLLEQLSKQNNDLKDALKSLEDRCTETETELQNFQKIYNDVVSAINPQQSKPFEGIQNDAPVKVEDLLDAVNEVRKQLVTLQEMNEQLKNEKRKSNAEERRAPKTDTGLLSLIQEMKEELQILKQTFHQIAADQEKQEQIALLREQMNALKEKYTLAAEENHKLMAQMEKLEKRVPSVGIFGEGNAVDKVQPGSKENSYEINQLYSRLTQNSEEFQKQMKELRDQLFRQEQLSNIKILKLEDELHARKLEINSLESRNLAEDEKRMRRMKELQDHLDEASANNQSLQKYVQFLKSSYFNVFGKF